MKKTLRVLIVDDSQDDALLLARKLKKEGYDLNFERVDTEQALKTTLESKPWDLVICDYMMPQFSAPEALGILKDSGLDTPFIVVSGIMGEETAVEMMKAGAHDYFRKDNLVRLAQAIERELLDAAGRQARKQIDAIRAATYKIAQAAIATENLEQLYDSIHDILGELMTVENFYIALYDPAKDLLSFPYFVDQYEQPPPPQKPGRGLTEYVLRTKQSLLAPPGVLAQFVAQGEIAEIGPTSIDWLGVPLTVNGQIIGVMATQSYTEGIRFSQDELELMQFVSSQVAQSIERKRGEHETRTRALQQAVVASLGQQALAGIELQDLMEKSVALVSETLNTEYCKVLELLPEGDVLLLRTGIGWKDGLVGHTTVGIGQDSQAGYTLISDEPIIVADLRTEKRFSGSSLLTNHDVVSGMSVVIAGQRQPFGVLAVHTKQYRAFSKNDIHFIQAVANVLATANSRLKAEEMIRSQVQRLEALHRIDRAIASSTDLNVTATFLVGEIKSQLNVDAVAILLSSPHTFTLEYIALQGFHVTAFHETHLTRWSKVYAGQIALERKSVFIPDLAREDDKTRSLPIIELENFVAYYGVPLIAKGQVRGVLEIFHRASLEPDDNWFGYVKVLATQAAIAIDNITLFDDLQRSNVSLEIAYDTTLEGWARTLELRDMETEGHSRRVVKLTEKLARNMGQSSDKIIHIRRGTLLHDIGKMGIPDSVLLKPGPLTDDEWKIMHQHPVYAYKMLSSISFLHQALDIPYCHHEKWDGSGYPRGLKGEQIPLSARIFAIVDVWDALNSDRPYREAWSQEKALSHIREQSGKHFDPQVVNVFLNQIIPNTDKNDG